MIYCYGLVLGVSHKRINDKSIYYFQMLGEFFVFRGHQSSLFIAALSFFMQWILIIVLLFCIDKNLIARKKINWSTLIRGEIVLWLVLSMSSDPAKSRNSTLMG